MSALGHAGAPAPAYMSGTSFAETLSRPRLPGGRYAFFEHTYAKSHPGEVDRLTSDGRLEPVAEFQYRPSDLVLLDGRPAWDLPPENRPVIERIRLLHVKR